MESELFTPTFSVIIPTYHRNDLLSKCLDCLHPDVQTLNSSKYEVIVSDDGHLTTAKQLINDQYPWVRWVRGPRKGPAANRNNGSKVARGQWLVFTDDDCLPESKWLSAYLESVVSSNADVVEGKTVADRPQTRYDEESPINETGGNLWACNFAVQAVVFKGVGCFDEKFIYAAMEDIDLHTRLKQHSMNIIFCEKALVIHPYRRKSNSRFPLIYQSKAYFFNKYSKINFDYRVSQAKHLIYSLWMNGIKLSKYRFVGWTSYLAEHVFLLRIIFIKNRTNKR